MWQVNAKSQEQRGANRLVPCSPGAPRAKCASFQWLQWAPSSGSSHGRGCSIHRKVPRAPPDLKVLSSVAGRGTEVEHPRAVQTANQDLGPFIITVGEHPPQPHLGHSLHTVGLHR